MGTVHFLAPEMVRPRGLQQRFHVGIPADIWSLGISLYSVLYGGYPSKHRAKRVSAILRRIENFNAKIEYPQEFSKWVSKTLGTESAGETECLRKKLKNSYTNLICVIRGCLDMTVPRRWSSVEVLGCLMRPDFDTALNLLHQKKIEYSDDTVSPKGSQGTAIVNTLFLNRKFQARVETGSSEIIPELCSGAVSGEINRCSDKDSVTSACGKGTAVLEPEIDHGIRKTKDNVNNVTSISNASTLSRTSHRNRAVKIDVSASGESKTNLIFSDNYMRGLGSDENANQNHSIPTGRIGTCKIWSVR